LPGSDYFTGHATDYIFGVQGIGTSDGTLTESHIESNASGGLIIAMANGSFDASNEYLFSGNNGVSGGTSTSNLTSIPAVEERIGKVWYLDKTGNVDAKLTFNIQESVGTSIFPAGNGYVLLYSSMHPLDFQNYTADHSINPVVSDEDISFTVPDAQLLDGYYTVGTTDAASNPLPIELLSFEVSKCENDVCLEWKTTTEINNEYFEIEKSKNGTDWASVLKMAGAGNSKDILSYSSKDQRPFSGASYYRLKQVDYDGQFSYSEVRRVTFEMNNTFNIYPNPTQNYFQINGENISDYSIKIYKVDGKVVSFTSQYSGTNQVSIDISQYPVGIYFISLEYQGIRTVKTLLRIE
jgi:hypothetical protein